MKMDFIDPPPFYFGSRTPDWRWAASYFVGRSLRSAFIASSSHALLST
jgi:hypothetical protein